MVSTRGHAAFPRLQASASDIRLVHYGLTRRCGMEIASSCYQSRSSPTHGPRATGVVSVVGVKYTTARLGRPERAIDAACEELRREPGHCRTAETLLPFAAIADVEGRLVETQRELVLDLEPDIAAHLASWYGSEAPEVLRYSAQIQAVDRLDGSTPVLAGEIAYAVARAAAVRLGDVVFRRTALGSAGHHRQPALARAGDIMAGALGWSAARQAEEITAVEARYPSAATAR